MTQSLSALQGVAPSAQKPVPPKMEAHTQEPPGPHAVKVSHVCPVQELAEQAPFEHVPESHYVERESVIVLVNSRHIWSRKLTIALQSPQLFGSDAISIQFPPHIFCPAPVQDGVAVGAVELVSLDEGIELEELVSLDEGIELEELVTGSELVAGSELVVAVLLTDVAILEELA